MMKISNNYEEESTTIIPIKKVYPYYCGEEALPIEMYYCSNCGQIILNMKERFCCGCGQKINWSYGDD